MAEKSKIPLHRDPRVRSLLVQITIPALLIWGIYIIFQNTVYNLAQRGIKTSFDFLEEVAPFAIGFFPFWEFNLGKSTYWDVFIIGIQNTILVAVLGIIAATILGFVIGIMRLSPNWLFSRFALIYVEVMRNVPLLLQIIFWNFAIFLAFLPGPRQSLSLFDSIFLNGRGLYLPKVIFNDTTGIGILIFLGSIVIGFITLAILRIWEKGDFGTTLGMSLLTIVGLLVSLLAAIPTVFNIASELAIYPAVAINSAIYSTLSLIYSTSDLAGFDLFFIFKYAFLIAIALTIYALVSYLIMIPLRIWAKQRNGTSEQSLPLGWVCVGFTAFIFILSLIFRDIQITPVLGAVLLGTILTVFLSGWADKRHDETGKVFPVYSVGLLVIIFLVALAILVTGNPFGLEFPELKRFNFEGGIELPLPLFSLWFALSIYTAAFIAENVRGGIQAVSHGQTEASQALGLPRGLMMQKIIIPQAMRVIIPPTISQYLNLTKNSSLAVAVAYEETVAIFAGIALNQTGQAVTIIVMTMCVYITLSLLTSLVLNIYNRSVQLVER